MAMKMLAALLRSLMPRGAVSGSRKRMEMNASLAARAQMARHAKLHLGCGNHIIEGWANIDMAGPDEVIKWDLSRPLPVESESVRHIYSEHFIEHISLDQATGLLGECRRVLTPGGVLRVSTPDLRKLIDVYLAGRLSEFHDVGWSPATPCRLLNEGMRSWGHQFLYDADELKRILETCGFGKITQVRWRESSHQELRELECRPFHDEIILEAVK